MGTVHKHRVKNSKIRLGIVEVKLEVRVQPQLTSFRINSFWFSLPFHHKITAVPFTSVHGFGKQINMGVSQMVDSAQHSGGQASKMIAIIDDDVAIQNWLRDLIQSAGLSTRCFGSAEEFLEGDWHRKGASLIVDLRKPKMLGLQLQVSGTTDDIAHPKSGEEEPQRLRQLEVDLAHINRVNMMGELAASLSHELKQPITATISNAQTCMRWLRRGQPDLAEACEALERIVEDGKRAADIIDRLRSLYKKAPAKREAVEVNEIIREMEGLLRGEANRHGVSIRTDLAAELPKITADRVQLQQVLMNLMLNGIEAMNETGGVLEVKSGLDQEGGLLISVSDTGVGLPQGKADQIFSAFFTTKPQGSGMGLSISRSIVESHGGRLWATPNSGLGATFHFTVPTAPRN